MTASWLHHCKANSSDGSKHVTAFWSRDVRLPSFIPILSREPKRPPKNSHPITQGSSMRPHINSSIPFQSQETKHFITLDPWINHKKSTAAFLLVPFRRWDGVGGSRLVEEEAGLHWWECLSCLNTMAKGNSGVKGLSALQFPAHH